MPETSDNQEFHKRMERLEGFLQELERLPDAPMRNRIREMVQAILDLHSTALQRLLQRLAEAGDSGQTMIDSLAEDDLIASLLLLYNLHPLDIEARVRQALHRVKPLLASHGGSVELLSTTDNIVRLRLSGSCHGCPSSAQTLKSTIEEAIIASAPDVAGIEVEGVVTDSNPQPDNQVRIALPILHG